MTFLGRGQSSSCTNPVLDIYTSFNGVLTDVVELSFQIFENITTPGVPIQIHPAILGDKETVLLTDCPTGSKLGTGHYVAPYTAPATLLAGSYEIRWFFKEDVAATEQTYIESFEVLTISGASGNTYASIQDIRDEGVTVAAASDARVLKSLIRASQYIDKFTRRHFAPVAKTITVNSNGGKMLFLDEPIIAITSISTKCCDGTTNILDTDNYVVYNRHLRDNLTQPDDRNNPHVTFCDCDTGEIRPLRHLFDCGSWLKGEQTVEITGIFGYTDYDGSAVGSTPVMIGHAATMLAAQYALSSVVSSGSSTTSADISRIKREKTVDQEIEYFSPNDLSGGGASRPTSITGNADIDEILLMFRAPAKIGKA